jgi:competence protein ComEC
MRLVYFVFGGVAGILLAASVPRNSAVVWLAALVLAVALLRLARHVSPGRALGWVALGFALGGLRFALLPPPADISHYNQMGGMTLEGVVVAEPDVRDERIDLRVQAETVTRAGKTLPTDGTVLVQLSRNETRIHYGDVVRVTGDLIVPPRFDGFSYADYLARSGVYSILRHASVEVLRTGAGNPLLAALFTLKDRARTNIVRSLPEPAAGLLSGILLGDARSLSPDVADAFNRVGASHIIAISGFNMAVVSGVVMRLLARMHIRGRRAAFLGIITVLLYTVLVGASPAVLRAALMSSLLVMGGALRRRTFVPASLAFATIVLAAINPNVLWDVGFQLSLFATLGISVLADPLGHVFQYGLARVLPRRALAFAADILAEPLVISVAAQIAVLPIIVLAFERLSLVALFVNLLVIPVQAYLLLMGLAALLVSLLLPAASQLLFWFDLVLLGWTLGVVRAFAQIPLAEVKFGADSRGVALYYLLLIGGAVMTVVHPQGLRALAAFVRRRRVLVTTAGAALLVIVLMAAVIISRPDGLLHVWFLDVGHSNAVLIQTPDGAHFLVDGGQYPSRLLTGVGDRLPFNDRVIESLLLTQPDAFNYAALPEMFNRYAVGVVLTNGQPNLEPAYVEMTGRLADRLLPVVAGYRAESSDGVRLEVLNPQTPPTLAEPLDDGTLVLRLTYGEVSFLLTGDLSVKGQEMLLDSGQWPLATVLQLPKHAAARSLNAAFWAAVQPSAAVVQIDPANQAGDPDGDVLRLLGAVPVYRTDHWGTVHFFTDGVSLSVVGDKNEPAQPE